LIAEDTMHNWLELHLQAREKMADALRTAEDVRRGRAAAPPGPEKRPTSLILTRGEVLSIHVRRGGLRITCRTGRVWATGSRSREDTLLTLNESVSYDTRGTVVIQALRTTTLRLDWQAESRVALGALPHPALLLG
jgi:hypothetical protein